MNGCTIEFTTKSGAQYTLTPTSDGRRMWCRAIGSSIHGDHVRTELFLVENWTAVTVGANVWLQARRADKSRTTSHVVSVRVVPNRWVMGAQYALAAQAGVDPELLDHLSNYGQDHTDEAQYSL